MLDALKFVQSGVSSKEIVEGLSHFKIENGHIRSFNGTFALSSPIDLDFNCTPKASQMIKAIAACSDVVQASLTNNSKLKIKSGSFTANIECLDTATPHVVPEGDYFAINADNMYKAFEQLYPVIGTDAVRPWVTSILLDHDFAYATNNVVAVQYWLGEVFPLRLAIPKVAVREILRIKEKPIGIQCAENNVTFHYESGRWLRTALIEDRWCTFDKLFEDKADFEEIDSTLFDALESIKPFCDNMGRVYIENGLVRTHYELSEGASFRIQNQNITGVYRLENLYLLKGLAKFFDGKRFPEHDYFMGDNLRGVIIGMKA